MSTIKTGWLKDRDGDKFAPKTLISQVQTSDGTLLEDKIQSDLDAAKEDILANVSIDVDDTLSSDSENPVQNKVINTALDMINASLSDIVDGSTKVGKAVSADNATNATKADTAMHAFQAEQDDNGDVISMTYETKSDASSKLTEAKQYADSAASTAANAVKNDLLNGAGAAYDTLKELGDLIDDNVDAIEALEAVAAEKVPATRKVNGKALDADITLSASDIGADASGSASSALASAQTYTDNAISQKSQVQIITWEDND